jgi:hypothetical protein
MKTGIKIYLLSVPFALLVLSSCKKGGGKDATNPVVHIPQEQITTVVLDGFNNDNPNDNTHQFHVEWKDLDGTGGNAPNIDSLLLDTGINYHVSILLLDETKNPVDIISAEVEELKNIHQFFYKPGASLDGKMTVQVLDYDNNNPPLPVGLTFLVKTKSSSSFVLPVMGELNIILSHYDGIPKTTSPSPESDLDITFPVRLK